MRWLRTLSLKSRCRNLQHHLLVGRRPPLLALHSMLLALHITVQPLLVRRCPPLLGLHSRVLSEAIQLGSCWQ